MAKELADLINRVEQVLVDTGNVIWSADTITEAIRLTLASYTDAFPYLSDTTLTLAADGRNIDITSLTDLHNIIDVQWPYTAGDWPPNYVLDWRILHDDGVLSLQFTEKYGSKPLTGEYVRLRWTKPQGIHDLDSFTDTTTIPDEHVDMFVVGAAGEAAMMRVIDLIEDATADLYQVNLIGMWASGMNYRYNEWLNSLAAGRFLKPLPTNGGWRIDKWDDRL